MSKSQDFFKTREDCIKNKYNNVNTNPRYKHFKQTHFTAGDEDQFIRHAFTSNTIKQCETFDLQHNIHVNTDHKVWRKNKELDDSVVYNTFKHISDTFKKGIFVKIVDNKLDVFLPFSKVNYKNSWADSIQIDYESIFNVSRNNSKFTGYVFKNCSINKFPDHWYANNSIIRMEFPMNEGDTNVSILKNMLEELCLERKVPDIAFFLNRRDNPIINLDETEPYDHIWGDGKKSKTILDQYVPVFSMSKQEKNADFLFPTYNDWARVQQPNGKWFRDACVDYKHNFYTWNNKIPIAVFRGSSTGSGVTTETNIRLKACYMTHLLDKKYNGKNPYLDAGINKWNLRFRKLKNNNRLQSIDPNKLPFSLRNSLTYEEQSKYKYILHLDGHVSAFRLSNELSFGSVILFPESKWKLWYSHLLKPYVHFVPIHKDLSNLVEQIKWCQSNDDQCKEISQNALKFYEKYLCRESILDYCQHLICCVTPLKISNVNAHADREKMINIHQTIVKSKYDEMKNEPTPHNVSYFTDLEKRLKGLIIKNRYDDFINDSVIFKSKKSELIKCKFEGETLTIKFSDNEDKKSEFCHEEFISTYTNQMKEFVPTFVYVYGSYIKNDRKYLVAEYIEGRTLLDLIQSDNFTGETLYIILLQLIFALDLAYKKHEFIHYDLTPWNVMVKTYKTKQTVIYTRIDGRRVAVKTHTVPYILDYGKSRVKHDEMDSNPNMFVTSINNFHDIYTLILTSYKIILKKHIASRDIKLYSTLFNLIPGYTANNIKELKKIVFNNSKYVDILYLDDRFNRTSEQAIRLMIDHLQIVLKR